MTEDGQLVGCIAWGSLVWNPGKLPIRTPWRTDGPTLPVEFARQSKDGRITLVLIAEGARIQCLWTLLDARTVRDAAMALADREDISRKAVSTCIGIWSADSGCNHFHGEFIGKWARENSLNAVVWTALPPKFDGRNNYVPTSDEVLKYLSSLTGSVRKRAKEYVIKAPAQVRTPYRKRIMTELGWGET